MRKKEDSENSSYHHYVSTLSNRSEMKMDNPRNVIDKILSLSIRDPPLLPSKNIIHSQNTQAQKPFSKNNETSLVQSHHTSSDD